MAVLSKRQQFLFWIVAAVLATAGLITIVAREHQPAPARHSLYVIGIPEKGAALFFGAKHCSICHAVNGAGGRVAPDLSGIHPGTPAMGWLASVLWNHAPGMWRQMRGNQSPRLNQEEMAHILAFLYQAGTADRPGDAAAGKRVFAAKGCAHCHSLGSEGGHLAPDLSHVAASGDAFAWMRAMWNHAQAMVGPITREIGQWPQFKGGEMNDLIAYAGANGGGATAGGSVLRGSAERGWQVFQAKCMACHAVRGNGGHVGPELGPDHDLPNTPAQFAAVLWNHAPAMLAHAPTPSAGTPALEGDEIADVLKFLVSLRYFEPVGSPFLGERVFTERGCARCHGAKAEGTREGPRLRSGGDAFTTVSLATALWSHGPAMRARAERLGIEWPTLEPTDIGDLISFLNDPGRQK
ncbi:MAG: cytochrome c [Acidobacteriia bacterium]|nr:cytochrome c [Terriglobia bacterium]